MARGRRAPLTPRPQGLAIRWFTYEEAGAILFRSPYTVQSLVSKHKVPKKLIRAPGRKRVYIVVLPASSIAWLHEKIHGFY